MLELITIYISVWSLLGFGANFLFDFVDIALKIAAKIFLHK